MYHFFVEPSQIHTNDNTVVILGSDVNHIKNVLRMKPGEEIAVSNGGDGREYRCGIKELNEESILCELRFIKEDGVELPSRVHLYQGLPKADKMELIIQKTVELGVAEIIPVAMKYCVVKLEGKKAAQRVQKWQAQAETAAKQSKRSIIPKIHEVVSFKEALKLAENCDIRLVPYENENGMEGTRTVLEQIEPGKSISIMIGPEGGFAEEEIAKARENMQSISLGRRILRTDTAGICMMSMLMLQLESRIERKIQ